MNKAQKGKRLERELELMFQENGFITHKATSNRFNRNDLWGCFDLMAKKRGCDYTFYVQCSTQWKYGKARKEIEAFPANPLDVVLMARRIDRSGFEFMRYFNDTWTGFEFNLIKAMVA